MAKKKSDTKGVTAEKDEFSEWFTQIMLKADLADYTDVSGAIVFKPRAYAIWEKIKEEVDERFKKLGIQNCYFPLFIPERNFDKLKEHTEGFAPEVAWVTHGGDTELKEKLAVRPTSETIMYESYAKWIRSWRDLPLKLNQWNNVVRWEFKHPIPFLRTREFLWNEGHTVYATREEAEAEGEKIIEIYDEVCRKYLGLPSLIGRKSEKEKFAGAEYTISMEFFMPNGKAIQGPDFHHDGQHFSKAYGIKFLNKEGKEDYVWQNTFAITTRMLGVMFAMHSDEKGLVLPPKIAPEKVAIVPILFEDSKEKVLETAREIKKKLGKGTVLDDRDEYKPGYKFNDWELKGVPLRIEIGPKDLAHKKVMVVRRDTGEKISVAIKDVKKKVKDLLDEIQKNLLEKAQKFLDGSIVKCTTEEEIKKAVNAKQIAFAPICGQEMCEDELKHRTGGAKVLNIPDKQPAGGACALGGGKAGYWAYIGKSY